MPTLNKPAFLASFQTQGWLHKTLPTSLPAVHGTCPPHPAAGVDRVASHGAASLGA